jgi:transposase-like protein
MMKCAYCQSSEKQVKAGKNLSGTQRVKCQVCGRRYTPEAKEHGYPASLREQAVKMSVDGINYRRIGRLLGVDHKSVMLWVKAHADSLPSKAPVPQQVVVAEQDELFTYVGKKKTKSSS